MESGSLLCLKLFLRAIILANRSDSAIQYYSESQCLFPARGDGDDVHLLLMDTQ